MPRNGNIALAVRENIALYMAARPKLKLRDIATTCDLSYSGLSKLMAAKSTVTALSTDTIDKLASGLNIPPAWLVISSGTEMANMRFTGAKAIDEFLILWAKSLFLGAVGYKMMQHHYADDYYCTASNKTKLRENGYEVFPVATLKKDGYDLLGISAQTEYAVNEVTNVQRFVIKNAKVISPHRVIIVHHVISREDGQRVTGSSASCLEFESDFKAMTSNVPAAAIKLKSNTAISARLARTSEVSDDSQCEGNNPTPEMPIKREAL
jgi:transcriptional regulator with XRE-family HTH domain